MLFEMLGIDPPQQFKLPPLLSERQACRALGVSRGSMRYQSVRPVPTVLLESAQKKYVTPGERPVSDWE